MASSTKYLTRSALSLEGQALIVFGVQVGHGRLQRQYQRHLASVEQHFGRSVRGHFVLHHGVLLLFLMCNSYHRGSEPTDTLLF